MGMKEWFYPGNLKFKIFERKKNNRMKIEIIKSKNFNKI